MDKAKRKAIIAGNWKMNKTASEAAVLVDELVPAVQDAGCEVVICTPYTDLVTAVEKTKGTNIHVGAENVHFEKSGAFTGEISADMLVDLGVEYVIAVSYTHLILSCLARASSTRSLRARWVL